jgi:ribonuclease Y
MSLTIVFLVIGGLTIGGVAGYYFHDRKIREQRRKYKAKIQKSDELIEQKMQQADQKYENKLKEAELKGRKIIEGAEKELEKRQDKLEQMEERIVKKEEKIDEKLEILDKEKESLHEKSQMQKQQRETKQQEIQETIEQQKKKLSDIADLKPADAKAELMHLVEIESQKEIVEFVEKSKTIKKEEADKEAQHIISRVLPRIAMNSVAEFTVAMIDIPSEDYKGKLIGRE